MLVKCIEIINIKITLSHIQFDAPEDFENILAKLWNISANESLKKKLNWVENNVAKGEIAQMCL